MSTVAQSTTVQSLLSNWCRQLAGMYAKDLAHVSPERFSNAAGGATRSVADFTAEITAMCYGALAVLNGGDIVMPTEEQMAANKAKFTDAATAAGLLTEAAGQLADAIAGAPGEALDRSVMAPWGQPMTVAEFVNIMVNHIWYHDGQVNYVQALDGDEAVHWMEA